MNSALCGLMQESVGSSVSKLSLDFKMRSHMIRTDYVASFCTHLREIRPVSTVDHIVNEAPEALIENSQGTKPVERALTQTH